MPLRLTPPEATPEWIASFREAERRGFRTQLNVRALVLLVIALSFIPASWERLSTVAAYCGALVVLGIVVDRLVVRTSERWWRVLAGSLIAVDVTTLCLVIALPSLVIDIPWPPRWPCASPPSSTSCCTSWVRRAVCRLDEVVHGMS